jgi:hypothetical protein
MPSPRFLALLLALGGSVAAAHGETFYHWVHAAPAGEVTFNPWQPQNEQGLYGYLDLSKLPASAFPVRVRVMYAGDFDRDSMGPGFHSIKPPDLYSPMTAPRVTVETTLASPGSATAVPVWTSPIPMRDLMPGAGGLLYETVRLEVIGHDDAVLCHYFVGASQLEPFVWGQRRIVVLNSSEATSSFQGSGFASVGVTHLVPDAYAFNDVKAIWIDSTAAADPALTDAFWRRLILQGAFVAGGKLDVQAIATRLGIDPATPQLLGGMIAADEPPQVLPILQENMRYNPYGGPGVFIQTNFQPNDEGPGKTMHQQLLNFSRVYLGLFFVCEALVVFVAFLRLRGRQRVWLWFVIPVVALAYALLGIVAARIFITVRAEARIEQMEMQRQGWPEAALVTSTWQVKMDGSPASFHFPADSHLSNGSYGLYQQEPEAQFTFRQAADSAEFICAPGAARHGDASIYSWIPAQAPVDISAGGKLTARRNFDGAWAWDGDAWRELGALQAGEAVTLADERDINVGEFEAAGSSAWERLGKFPEALRPLLDTKHTSALTAASEGIFLGVQPIADCQLDDASDYSLHSRRVVVYQFQLPKGGP